MTPPVGMSVYLMFEGDCEAAFALYARSLGGVPGTMFRYRGSALAAQAPPEWADKIMHGSITVGGQLIMGADVAPGGYQEPKGFSLTVEPSSAVEAERVFRELSEGGEVVMPLEKTFWAERFGVLVDRFGIPWQINYGDGDTA